MNNIKPRVISFVSGKGGSGKTTVAIAISKLLADMGYPCLLIDFDLATNGSSYFFKKQFTRTSKGIWEMMAETPTYKEPSVQLRNQLRNLPFAISENFYFVASRVNINVKGESYDSVSYKKESLKNDILMTLIDWATEKGVRYVLIDCQAGYTISSTAAAEVAEMAIIVTEADSISSDASDNLLIQLGHSLPNERRYLVNKVDVRDADTYRNMRNVFQSLNRLPPLPFDFAVRNAFGARQIPIDINNPSPLLFALFETAKYIFTEIFEKIESYKTEHVDSLFEKYDKELRSLLEEKQKLEQEQAEIKMSGLRSQHRLLSMGLTVATVLLMMYAAFNVFRILLWEELGQIFDVALPLTIVTMAAITAVYILMSLRRRFEKRLEDETREGELSRRIEDINKDLDHFRSLLWARSREFLVDAEVAGETRRTRSEEWKSYKDSKPNRTVKS